MGRYRKKPVVIEAVQYTGDLRSVIGFLTQPEYTQDFGTGALTVETLEGPLIAQVSDWIIKGVKGEFYPCKNDIFLATYDAVDDATR
jgi:hypothetical protein